MQKKFRLPALLILLAGAWVGALALGKLIEHRLNGRGMTAEGVMALPANQPNNGKLPVLWNAPSFSYVDQNGRTVTDKDLLGHVWIADFIFTQCTSACPMITAKLMLLQKAIRSRKIRFVSFSVDPEHDTPAALNTYARQWHGDESRWILLSTNEKGIQDTALGMKVAVQATGEKDNPIQHSSLMMLVDQHGQVRRVYDSAIDDMMTELASDAAALAGDGAGVTPLVAIAQPVAGADQVPEGEKLFKTIGCAACHDQPRVAPPLAGLFGSEVMLDDGKSVKADDAYLRDAITRPGVKLVAGYLRLMPSYSGHITGQQIDQLVAYIKSLKPAKEAVGKTGVQQVIDPVCKMHIRAGEGSPNASFDGKTYYFCSDKCKESFQKDAARFVAAH
jgi:protein SCO1